MKRLVLFASLLCAANARARSDWMNPGDMGANAVPGFPVEAPWSNDFTLLQLGNQLSYGAKEDVAMLPYWRLVTPFGKWISTYFEGSVIEFWWASERTKVEWALTRDSGVAKADLRFGFKLLLADLGEDLPKIGFRGLTKSTTGKGYEDRRFTDGPAYLLEFLVGEKLPVKGFDLQLLGMGGYWIWQQGESGQNDAITWGLAANARFFERLTIEPQVRGYVGWQKLDKPIILGLRVGMLVADWFEVSGVFNYGFRDAARYEGILTLNFRLPSLAPFLFDFFTPNTPILKHHGHSP